MSSIFRTFEKQPLNQVFSQPTLTGDSHLLSGRLLEPF